MAAITAFVGHLMGNNQVVFGIDGRLDVIAHDTVKHLEVFPSERSVQKIYDEMDLQRATQGFLWEVVARQDANLMTSDMSTCSGP